MAQFKELGIKGVWLHESRLHNDNRGFNFEGFKKTSLQQIVKRDFTVAQVNVSHSKLGTMRGIHLSIADEGQAKLVTCVSGRIWDVAVDLRVKSPTFKKWVGVELDSKSGKSLFISEGIGHGFLVLEERTAVVYLMSTPYSPNEEIAVNARDPEIAIEWPGKILHISARDDTAPLLAEILETLVQSPHSGA